ncbi:MAG TPA: alpha/beta hydrolase [Kofleriaceae bacterium]|nr:alpha/beta hydrolase [Kofleriaceae bacterium]
MSAPIRVLDDSIAVRSRGTGRPIVLVHGNSCSSRSFELQLAGELARSFRVIAIDLPGHGDSAPAADPERTYTLPGYAAAIARIAEALDAEDGVFVGWSLGGHAVLEASERLSRAAGFAIFGAPPVSSFAEFGGATFPRPEIQAAFLEHVPPDAARALVSVFLRPGAELPAVFLDDVARTDGRARACLAASAGRGELADERRIVAALTRPLAILHGVHEQVVRGDYFATIEMPTLWRGAVQPIANAGHAPHWETPAAFDALIGAFANDCFRS